MKKLLLVALLGLGVFGMAGLNAENLSDKQFKQLLDDCVDNENVSSCQRLIDSGNLTSVEQCDKKTTFYDIFYDMDEPCNNIGLVYSSMQNYQQALKYFKKACELETLNMVVII